jgi:hypothetical protein
MHELGHLLLGLEYAEDPNDVMFETLDAGERRNPDRERIAAALADPLTARRRALWEAFFAELGSRD